MSAIQNVLCFPPNSFITLDLTRGFNRRLVWLVDANFPISERSAIKKVFAHYSPSAVMIQADTADATEYQMQKLLGLAALKEQEVEKLPLCLQYAKIVREISPKCMIVFLTNRPYSRRLTDTLYKDKIILSGPIEDEPDRTAHKVSEFLKLRQPFLNPA